MRSVVAVVYALYPFYYGMAQVSPQSRLTQFNSGSEFFFQENAGQFADTNTLFILKDKEFAAYFRKDGISFQWSADRKPFILESDVDETTGDVIQGINNLGTFKNSNLLQRENCRLDMDLDGINPDCKLFRGKVIPYYENFYGPSYQKGIMRVRMYSEIIYENIYPGIDLSFFTKNKELHYKFILHSGGNIEDIRYAFRGTRPHETLGSTNILTSVGSLIGNVAVSDNANNQVFRFFTHNDNISYKLAKQGKASGDIIIEENLLWENRFPIDEQGNVWAVETDSYGSIYISGRTNNDTGLSLNGHQDLYGGDIDAFIVKMNSEGVKQWATYYGGVTSENGSGLATDTQGNVYLTGETGAMEGISSGGHQDSIGGSYDAFIAKFDSNGIRLWSTYYGGEGSDLGTGIATDDDDNVYLLGITNSTEGISFEGHQNSHGGSEDCFLAKFNSSGVRQWATYFGGTANDIASNQSLGIDNEKNVYITGWRRASLRFLLTVIRLNMAVAIAMLFSLS